MKTEANRQSKTELNEFNFHVKTIYKIQQFKGKKRKKKSSENKIFLYKTVSKTCISRFSNLIFNQHQKFMKHHSVSACLKFVFATFKDQFALRRVPL